MSASEAAARTRSCARSVSTGMGSLVVSSLCSGRSVPARWARRPASRASRSRPRSVVSSRAVGNSDTPHHRAPRRSVPPPRACRQHHGRAAGREVGPPRPRDAAHRTRRRGGARPRHPQRLRPRDTSARAPQGDARVVGRGPAGLRRTRPRRSTGRDVTAPGDHGPAPRRGSRPTSRGRNTTWCSAGSTVVPSTPSSRRAGSASTSTPPGYQSGVRRADHRRLQTARPRDHLDHPG